MQMEKWSEAEAMFREAARLRPNDGSPYANLAGSLFRQNRNTEARQQALKAIERGQRSHWVYRELGLNP
jgi:Flp pilus assembly protein TadD